MLRDLVVARNEYAAGGRVVARDLAKFAGRLVGLHGGDHHHLLTAVRDKTAFHLVFVDHIADDARRLEASVAQWVPKGAASGTFCKPLVDANRTVRMLFLALHGIPAHKGADATDNIFINAFRFAESILVPTCHNCCLKLGCMCCTCG